jgi:hypothetical protein
MKKGNWTSEEKEYLRQHWVEDGSVKVGKVLDRNHRNVGCMAMYLGLRSGWGTKPRFRHYPINEEIFKTWTRESAYLAGLVLTDGNISKSGREFSITSKDIELLEKAREALGSQHPIKEYRKDVFRLAIGHRGIVLDLQRIGIFENKSKSVSMPNVPDNFFFDFLRGYIDGDGMIAVRPSRGITVKLCTGSPYILDDISSAITKHLDIDKHNQAARTQKRKETVSTWYELSYYGQNAVKICEAIYQHCGNLYLSRKRQAFIDFRDRPRSFGLRNNGNATRYNKAEIDPEQALQRKRESARIRQAKYRARLKQV